MGDKNGVIKHKYKKNRGDNSDRDQKTVKRYSTSPHSREFVVGAESGKKHER